MFMSVFQVLEYLVMNEEINIDLNFLKEDVTFSAQRKKNEKKCFRKRDNGYVGNV